MFYSAVYSSEGYSPYVVGFNEPGDIGLFGYIDCFAELIKQVTCLCKIITTGFIAVTYAEYHMTIIVDLNSYIFTVLTSRHVIIQQQKSPLEFILTQPRNMQVDRFLLHKTSVESSNKTSCNVDMVLKTKSKY